MKEIRVTQFIRPNARQEPTTTLVSDAAGEKFEELTKLGLRLTAEVVPAGLVNVCVSDDEVGGDFDMILHANDHTLQAAIEGMLLRFSEENYRKWLAEEMDEGDEETEEND